MTRIPKFPSVTEMQSAFGCDCDINEDFVQRCVFEDANNSKLTITFSPLEASFGISLYSNEREIFRMYDEFFVASGFDEKNQLIFVDLEADNVAQRIVVTLWPEFLINITRMK